MLKLGPYAAPMRACRMSALRQGWLAALAGLAVVFGPISLALAAESREPHLTVYETSLVVLLLRCRRKHAAASRFHPASSCLHGFKSRGSRPAAAEQVPCICRVAADCDGMSLRGVRGIEPPRAADGARGPSG